MNKKNYLKAKLLRKAFNNYPANVQQQLKDKYALLIHSLPKNRKTNESYSYYVKSTDKLSAEEKTIVFYGVPIRLSKTQFAFLYIVLTDSSFSSFDYGEISEKSNEKKLITNFKTFISRFNKKCKESIKKYKSSNDCYFSRMRDKEMEDTISELLSYRLGNYNNYEATTKLKLKEESLAQKYFRKNKY